jgi:P-type Cu+ transporter
MRSAARMEGIRAADTKHAKGAEMTDLNRGHTHHDHDHHHAGHDVRVRATVKDPVCGMMVAPDQTEHHARHGGAEFHFCSARCRDKFVADPER